MQRLDLQFYAFFAVVLCGAVLGLLFDFLRVVVRRWRLGLVMSAAADLLFWAAATVAISAALFYGNWGDRRLYVLVGLLAGVSLYGWLASPVVSWLIDLVLRFIGWLVHVVEWLFLKLIWAPLVALANLLIAIFMTLGRMLWRILCWLGGGVARLLRGPSRLLRLHYLLTKRKWRRFFRHWR
ncbi:MAG TPA: spore cortex biosynthesis protein YabQ [Symbiobacteriaceae bacterium]